MTQKKICIIYTGGTIGMMHSPNGYVPNPDSFRSNLEAIPDLNHPQAPAWDLVQFSPLLDSSDITVREWNKIGEAAFHDKKADGDSVTVTLVDEIGSFRMETMKFSEIIALAKSGLEG